MALASLGTALMLGRPGSTTPPEDPNAAKPVEVEVEVEARSDETRSDETRSACAWDSLRALGYVPVGPSRVITTEAEQPVAVSMTLEPDPRGCSELAEGRCVAGCFEIMATACDGSVGPLTVEVTPAGEPEDVIAQSLEAGASAAAGFCYGFPLGRAGRMDIVARVTTPRG